jgi:hypothetical protein
VTGSFGIVIRSKLIPTALAAELILCLVSFRVSADVTPASRVAIHASDASLRPG